MKQFKNAIAVAIAAAGLYSVSAMAGTAVHWADSDAGSSKDVKWQVVQPSRLDFTITTIDVHSIDSNGVVNGDGTGSQGRVGSWSNNGQSATVQTSDLYETDKSWAAGDVGSEVMLWAMCINGDCGNRVRLDGKGQASAGASGTIYGYIYPKRGDGQKSITDIKSVKSSKFTSNITVTMYTA